MNNKVSIIVLSYNSACYILDTLQSIIKQTYKNIEVIICDDSSKDNSLEVIKNWINDNNTFKVTVLESSQNRGIPYNCNRGLKASSGYWIKYIAADDILKENCIDEFVRYSKQNNSEISFSNLDFIDENNQFIEAPVNFPRIDTSYFTKSSKEQLNLLVFEKVFLPAPTAFFARSFLDRIGPFDESIPLIEDYPLWIKAIRAGEKINFLNKKLVNYRIHQNSLSSEKNWSYLNCYFKIYLKYRFPELFKIKPIYSIYLFIKFSVLKIYSDLIILRNKK